MFIEANDDGSGGDNWTTGAISRAKLQSNDHHQQTNIQFLYRSDALAVVQPTVSKHSTIRIWSSITIWLNTNRSFSTEASIRPSPSLKFHINAVVSRSGINTKAAESDLGRRGKVTGCGHWSGTSLRLYRFVRVAVLHSSRLPLSLATFQHRSWQNAARSNSGKQQYCTTTALLSLSPSLSVLTAIFPGEP